MHMLMGLGMCPERLQIVRQVVVIITRMAGSSLYNRPVTVLLRITILRIYALMPALCIRKGFQNLALRNITCTKAAAELPSENSTVQHEISNVNSPQFYLMDGS